MVLAKLFSANRSRLEPRQVLSLAQLDLRLDVTSDRFKAAVNRLIEQFTTARASLDLAAYAWSPVPGDGRVAASGRAGRPAIPAPVGHVPGMNRVPVTVALAALAAVVLAGVVKRG